MIIRMPHFQAKEGYNCKKEKNNNNNKKKVLQLMNDQACKTQGCLHAQNITLKKYINQKIYEFSKTNIYKAKYCL